MKRMLALLLLCCGTALAADPLAVPPPFLFAPDVRRVETSHDGYVLTFTDGRKADVWKSGDNYVIAYRDGRRAYASKLSAGWSVRGPGENLRRWDSLADGYSGQSRVTYGSQAVTVREKASTRRYLSVHDYWRVMARK